VFIILQDRLLLLCLRIWCSFVLVFYLYN
jgi:hypothetical protein